MVIYFHSMEESVQRAVSMKGVGWRVFLRSFLIEIMWNYPRMQNIGFTFSFLPALDRLKASNEAKREIVRKQLRSANTNPTLGPMCLGAIAKIDDSSDALPTAGLIKKRLMSTLAAQGDRIIWGVVRPLFAFVAVIMSVTSGSAWWVPVTVLAIYNIPNMAIRYIGFNIGWNDGIDVARRFKSRRLEWFVRCLRGFLFFCAGSLTGVSLICVARYSSFSDMSNIFGVIVLSIVVLATCFVALMKGVSQTRVIYPTIAAMFTFVYFVKNWN